MLIEFRVKNFRSFRDEAVLSLVARPDKGLRENTKSIASFGNRSLLLSAVIYGPNAAGKTNLIAAAQFVDKFINTSGDRKINSPIDVKPFLLTEDLYQNPSEFEISFIDDEGIRYQYGFHLTTEKVVREWLIAYPKGLPQTWYERNNDNDLGSGPNWYFGPSLKGKNNNVAELTRPDVLFLSNAAKFNHRQLSKVFAWFQKSLHVIDFEIASQVFPVISAKMAQEDKNSQFAIRRLLEIADFGISGFDVREETYTEKDLPDDMPIELRKQLVNQKHIDVFMQHQVKENITISFPIEEESSGTQRFFALSGPLNEVLKNGWTLFIDELDASLHPLLVRYLISLFHNPVSNPKGAQLIFNTHDTTLMDCCLFRRDQIWFVEKDNNGCSHLYPLLDFSPRKDEALAKGYLMGRYGAIPFLGEPNWAKEEKPNE